MRRVLRLMVVVILACAVPLQGIASVAAGQCMALSHHDDGSNADHSHSHDTGGELDLAAHGHSDDAASSHSHGDEKGAHCGPCVACCASVSIVSTVALVWPVVAHAGIDEFSYVLLAGVRPDELYRPPLSL